MISKPTKQEETEQELFDQRVRIAKLEKQVAELTKQVEHLQTANENIGDWIESVKRFFRN